MEDGNMLIYLNLLKKSVVSIIVVHIHLGKVVLIVATKRVRQMEIIMEVDASRHFEL